MPRFFAFAGTPDIKLIRKLVSPHKITFIAAANPGSSLSTEATKGDILIIGNYPLHEFLPPEFYDGIEPVHQYASHYTVLSLIALAAEKGMKIMGFNAGAALLATLSNSRILKRDGKGFFVNQAESDESYDFYKEHYFDTKNNKNPMNLLHGIFAEEVMPLVDSNHKFLIYPFDLPREVYRIVAYAVCKSVGDLENVYAANYGTARNYFADNTHPGMNASRTISAYSQNTYFSIGKEIYTRSCIVDPEIVLFRNTNMLCITDVEKLNDKIGSTLANTEDSINNFDQEYMDYLKTIINKFSNELL